MTLSVIGAGIGRTGTTSLKLALEHLGMGPCYHMQEVLRNPSSAEHWVRAAQGEPMDWDDVFQGYNSTTDWPACDYWKELADHWPESKIILTVRDPEAWFASTQKTIFGPIATPPPGDQSPIARLMRAVTSRSFGGIMNDHDKAIAAFERHNASVRDEAPPDRFLVFEVGHGWEPLCRFLDVAMPSIPFPTANTSDDFQVKAESDDGGGDGSNGCAIAQPRTS